MEQRLREGESAETRPTNFGANVPQRTEGDS